MKEDAADLEERQVMVLAIRIVPERVEQPGQQTWPQHVHIAAQRIRQANRIAGRQLRAGLGKQGLSLRFAQPQPAQRAPRFRQRVVHGIVRV